MAQPLQVICLISGGKDSFFSLLHCLANGHHVVALANLYPPPPASSPTSSPAEDQHQDLNSYMYQTVGHTLIPLYATALGLPLYRQQILGSAVNAEKEYSVPTPSSPSAQREASTPADVDETESLLPLLQRIMTEHPAANALSTGAILSTYQRTRIESVALRLSLIPLSFLWQYPYLPTPPPHPGPSPSNLLLDMAAVGLEARIIKVASGGLDESVLWGNVCEEGVLRRVERAVGRFGGSVVGEGGEYETLAVAGPRGVWKGNVKVGERERVVRRGEGGQGWVEFWGEGRVEMFEGEGEGEREGGGEAEGEREAEGKWRERLKMPGLWDERFERLLEDVQGVNVEGMVREMEGVSEVPADGEGFEVKEISNLRHSWAKESTAMLSGSTLFISHLTGFTGSDIEDEMMEICTKLSGYLVDYKRSPSDIVFTTILLRSMADFAKVNVIYAKLFTKPNPPARATVGAGNKLPKGVDVVLSAVVYMGPRGHLRGLHVQSRSYWAPANIGPYSQAIAVKGSEETEGSLVYVAGQIPLVPATMEVLKDESPQDTALDLFRKQVVLALQHLWRIGIEMEVSWWTGAIAFLVGGEDVRQKALIALLCWEKMHQRQPDEEGDDEDTPGRPDAWDKKYGGLGSLSLEPESRSKLPDFEKVSLTGSMKSLVPGFFAVQMDELPRGCEIEWQSLGIAHSKVRMSLGQLAGLRLRQCTITESAMTVACVEIPLSTSHHFDETECLKGLNKAMKYFGQEVHVVIYTPHPAAFSSIKAQIIPCRGIWGCGRIELAAGVVARYKGTL